MLGHLIVWIFIFSFVTALSKGKVSEVCAQLLASPEQALSLCVCVGCSICFWSGVMEVARQSGILKRLSKLFAPILKLLFPKLKKDSPAIQSICTNLAANLLGLGAAAAPAGIRAVQELQKNCSDPTIASDYSILLILLNTASLQLIPTTAAMLRLKSGSTAPMEILPAVWFSSVLSVSTGIIAAKLFSAICKAPSPLCHALHGRQKT